jgi:hypothetical protein
MPNAYKGKKYEYPKFKRTWIPIAERMDPYTRKIVDKANAHKLKVSRAESEHAKAREENARIYGEAGEYCNPVKAVGL